MKKTDRLHVIDPNNPSNDISGGSRNISLILEKFATARAEILLAMRSGRDESFLRLMIGGDYSRYIITRQRLRKLSHKLGIAR